jgi:hypothetical protein
MFIGSSLTVGCTVGWWLSVVSSIASIISAHVCLRSVIFYSGENVIVYRSLVEIPQHNAHFFNFVAQF